MPTEFQCHPIISLPSNFRGTLMVRFPLSLPSRPTDFQLWLPAPKQDISFLPGDCEQVLVEPIQELPHHEVDHNYIFYIRSESQPQRGGPVSIFVSSMGNPLSSLECALKFSLSLSITEIILYLKVFFFLFKLLYCLFSQALIDIITLENDFNFSVYSFIK